MKSINLKVLLCLAVALCTVFVMFSACTESGENQTAESSTDTYVASPIASISPTIEPSVATHVDPSIVPITLQPTSPSPEPEFTHDYEMLRAFFDTPSKVEGKTNGQILFKDYDSGNPNTWHLRTEKEHKEYVEYQESIDSGCYYNDEFLLWYNKGVSDYRRYSGYLTEIESYFFEEEKKILNFGGTLRFDGFESLRSIELCNISADELIIENCGKLEYVSMYIDLEKSNHFFEKVYINARIGSSDIYPCAREFRLVVPAPEWLRDFDITALADGDGIVSVSLDYDTHYPNVVIYAAAAEGSHFVGWYDEEGHKVSENEWFVLTEGDKLVYSEDGQLIRIEDKYYNFDEVATYTAKFEKD